MNQKLANEQSNKTEFIVAFCKDGKKDVEISTEEAVQILSSLNLYLKEVARLHGSKNEFNLKLKATNKGSLELMFSIAEVAKAITQLPLDLTPILPMIAQNAGFLGEGVSSVISFLKDMKGDKKNIATATATTNGIIINGNNYGTIVVNISNSSAARKELSDIATTLERSSNFDEIEIREPETKKRISGISKEEAKYFRYEVDEDYDYAEESIEILRIVSSQFVGQSQWKFKIKNQKVFKAKIADIEWLTDFQKGKIELNPRYRLKVHLLKKMKELPNKTYEIVGFEIIKIQEILKPTKQMTLI